MARPGTRTAATTAVRLQLFCLLVCLVSSKPHPSKLQDVFDAHRTRRDLGEARSWRYTRHAIDVLKADLNNNDLYFCRGDPFRGIQCPEEPFCSAWDQICDDEQICALEHRKECLERSEASFGRTDARLCDGDENPKWCRWKYQAPVRCGEDIFLKPTKKKIRIQSPRYPDLYPGDYFCFWTVSVPEGHRLAVNFLRFETEENYDLLSLGTGYNRENSRSTIIFKHSGRKKPSPSQFDLNANIVWITFKSDDWENFKGFVIEFTDRERKEFGVLGTSPFNQEPNRDCGGKILMDSSTETTIKSPGHPRFYPNNIECEWVASIEEGLRIRIHFDAFDVEEEEDHLSVGNGVSSRRAPILYKYSSRTMPTDIISRASDVWFKFVSSVAVARTGFKVTLTEQPINDCGGIFTVPSTGRMSFGSPDYPNNYAPLENCLWQFRSASDRRIYMGFTEFSTESTYDRVKMGNGFEPNVDMTNVVLEHSGDYLPGGGKGSLAFRSKGPVAWLEFKSDDFNQKQGFRFNVYSEESSPWIVEESVPEIDPTESISEIEESEIEVELPDLQLQDQEIDDPNVHVGGGQDEGDGDQAGGKNPKDPSKDTSATQVPEPEPEPETQDPEAEQPVSQEPDTDEPGIQEPNEPEPETEPEPEPEPETEPEPEPEQQPPKTSKKPKKNKKNATTPPPTAATEEPSTAAGTTTAQTTTEGAWDYSDNGDKSSVSDTSDSFSSEYDSGFSTSSSK